MGPKFFWAPSAQSLTGLDFFWPFEAFHTVREHDRHCSPKARCYKKRQRTLPLARRSSMKLQAGLWCFLLQSSRTKSTKISQQMSTGSRDRLSSESHEFTFSVRSLSCVFGGGSLIVSRLFRGCLPSLQSIQLVYHLKQMSSGLKRSISSTEMRTIVPWFGWSSCVCSAHVCPP